MQKNRILDAVIFDWAGTIIDYGSLATIIAIKKIFNKKNIKVTHYQIQKDMGVKKIIHLKKILNLKNVNKQWENNFGKKVNKKDLNILSKELDEELLNQIEKKTRFIKGFINAVKFLKSKKIKIGTTTGYSRTILNKILNITKKMGFTPNAAVSVSDVKKGRPHGDMCLKNLKLLKLNEPKKCIKIDDSISGIKEGNNAGMITVGVSLSGIQVGLSYNNFKKLNKKKMNRIKKKITKKFILNGANYVIDDVSKLPVFLKQNFNL